MVQGFDYTEIFKRYSQFQNIKFLDRYLSFRTLEDYLKKEIFPSFSYEVIGFSELNHPIYSINLGGGLNKILIWSQMHGNESTSTKSILDLLNFLRYNQSNASVDYLLKTCSIKIIPMLNPDGATNYTRLNANGIDLNRDAVRQSQKETKTFFKCLQAFKPDFCFNMHGQRTIFSAGKSNESATMSFLAPSYDYDLNINRGREIAMKLILAANKALSEFIPDKIGKYDDAHNPNCFGDHIQKMGIPTILFEAGHFPGDYNRNITRKFVSLSVLKMLESIAYTDFDSYNVDAYENIPDNEKLFFDVIISNVKNSGTSYVGIQFNEVLRSNHIKFKPYIRSLEDLSEFHAHRTIDAGHSPIKINDSLSLKTDISISKLQIDDKVYNFQLLTN